MKKLLLKRLLGVTLLLVVFTSGLCAKEGGVTTFDELKLGDWFILTQTKRQDRSNELTMSWQGDVINRTKKEVTIEFTLTHLLNLRSVSYKTGGKEVKTQSYVDTNFPYEEDGEVRSDLIANPPKITITRSLISESLPTIEVELSDTLFSYRMKDYLYGLANKREVIISMSGIGKLDINYFAEELESFLLQDKFSSLAGWRVGKTSFELKPNTTIYYKLDGCKQDTPLEIFKQSNYDYAKLFEKLDDTTYFFSLYLDEPTKFYMGGADVWLTPGDSLVITRNGAEELSFSGKGAEICEVSNEISTYTSNINNNLNYQYSDMSKVSEDIEKIESIYKEKLHPNRSRIDPYWYQSAKLSLHYIKSTVFFGALYKVQDFGVVDNWDIAPFDSICPIIDYRYQPDFFNRFITAFYRYNSNVLNQNNLTNKMYWGADRGTFYLIKQLFSGYIQSYLWIENLEQRLGTESLSDLKEEISILDNHCFEPELRARLSRLEAHYSKLENGENIKKIDEEFVKLLPLKESADGYILFNISIFKQDNSIFADIDTLLIEQNIKDEVTWVNIGGGYVKSQLTKEQLKGSEKYGYIWLESNGCMDAFHDLGLDENILLVLRSDGTIIGRVNISHDAEGQVKEIILRDKEEGASAPLLSQTQLYVALGVFVLLTLVIGLYYRSRIRKQKLQTKLSQLKLRAIRSQMNPHFIFNALTSIQSLILKSDTEQANRYLTTFSRMLRNVLTSSDKTLVALSSELELVEQYLQIEQLRMPIEYKLEVATDICIDEVEIPGMILQPIVENAIIHGLFPQQGGEVKIRLWLENSCLWCEIVDNGVGVKKTSDTKSNFGLYSIQERLTLLNYSKESQVKLSVANRADSEAVSGCRVVITIPL